MVLKRKAPRRNVRRGKRARTMRGRVRGMRYPNKVYAFRRWANPNILSMTGADGTGATSGFTIRFQLSQIAANTEFTGLFDQYKITGVRYRFVLSRSPEWVTTVGNRGLYPFIIWAHDYDGGSGQTDVTALRQYANCKEWQMTENQPRTRWYFIKPSILNTVFQGVTSAYSPKWNEWIDVSYPDVQHFGIDGTYSNLYLGTTLAVEAIFYVKFRGAR